MAFGRFFGKREDAPPAPPADERDDDELEVPEGEPEQAPEEAGEIDWTARALAIIPGGASAGSKRPDALYGEGGTGPTHFSGAVGCRVVDAHGFEYIDCTMALGAVSLGYGEPEVTRAVVEAATGGNIAGLSDVREVEVAERLCDVVPCGEMAQFFRTGADAVSAAVRVARVYTGRDAVVGSGYFGWHDWSSQAAGVPAATRSSYRAVPFDDVEALDRAASEAGDSLAAIVLEPVVERMPSAEWVTRARALCDRLGAVLILDEMKTGFRVRTGGYQELAEVTPDLATFGKALANGYPLAALVGRKELMEASRRSWISSTLAGESTGLAAALAMLHWHERADITASLWSIGADLRAGVDAAIQASGIDGVRIEGIDPMWLLRFDDPAHESRFVQLAALEGLLMKRGAYNFAAIAHDDDVIRRVEAAASAALITLRDEIARA